MRALPVLLRLAVIASLLTLLPGQSQTTDDLRSRLQKLFEQGWVPGASAALIEKGEIVWTESFGVRSTEGGLPINESVVFEAASLSKPVFAAAVLQMVIRGEFDLDQPLHEILPYPRLEHDPRYRKITARHVLSHSPGLPNWGGTPLEMIYAPGEGWGYSGEGFVYLQRVIEKQTRLSLNDFVRREVFQPLGMFDSSFVWSPSFSGRAASGHDSLGEARAIRQREEANAAASLVTTAADYARFVSGLLKGRLKPETLPLMASREAQVANWGNKEFAHLIGWGLSWGIQPDGTLWHWGDNGIFRCYVEFDPKGGNGFILLTNSENGLSIMKEAVSLVLPGERAAFKLLQYESYDEPSRMARLKMQKSFLTGPVESSMAKLKTSRQADPDVIDERFLNQLGQFLIQRDRNDEALSVLRYNLDEHPDAAPAWDRLGEALMAAGELEQARSSFVRAQKLDPEFKPAEIHIQWLEPLFQASASSTEVSSDRLAALAGSYGPRQVRLRDGVLYYERQGGTEYRMRALNKDLFALEGLPTFRLKFVTAEDGSITKVVGLYFDGRQDESPRDPD